MELDDSSQTSTSSGTNETSGKQNGERNLATRRHTVGPSETAHNQVIGKHMKFGNTCPRGVPPSFYPTTPGLGYSPWNLPSRIAYNPLLGIDLVNQARLGLASNFEQDSRFSTGAHAAAVLNSQSPASSGQDQTSLLYCKLFEFRFSNRIRLRNDFDICSQVTLLGPHRYFLIRTCN